MHPYVLLTLKYNDFVFISYLKIYVRMLKKVIYFFFLARLRIPACYIAKSSPIAKLNLINCYTYPSNQNVCDRQTRQSHTYIISLRVTHKIMILLF